MTALGHDQFAVGGHDRGSYYALRIALEHPDRVTRWHCWTVCRSVSTSTARTPGSPARGGTGSSSFNLIPERVINANPDSWYRGGPVARGEESVAEWRTAIRDPAVVRGMLEDYRAGLGIDAEHERADRAAGRRLEQSLLVLWSTRATSRTCTATRWSSGGTEHTTSPDTASTPVTTWPRTPLTISRERSRHC